MTPRRQTSIHEAGHACAALILGIPGIGAVIFEGGGGCATPRPEVTTAINHDNYMPEALDGATIGDKLPELFRDAVFAAAGCVAVRLASRDPMGFVVVESYDARMINAYARRAFSDCDLYTERAFTDLATARARCLLGPVRDRMLAVAEELDRRGVMTAAEIASTMFPKHEREK